MSIVLPRIKLDAVDALVSIRREEGSEGRKDPKEEELSKTIV